MGRKAGRQAAGRAEKGVKRELKPGREISELLTVLQERVLAVLHAPGGELIRVGSLV